MYRNRSAREHPDARGAVRAGAAGGVGRDAGVYNYKQTQFLNIRITRIMNKTNT